MAAGRGLDSPSTRGTAKARQRRGLALATAAALAAAAAGRPLPGFSVARSSASPSDASPARRKRSLTHVRGAARPAASNDGGAPPACWPLLSAAAALAVAVAGAPLAACAEDAVVRKDRSIFSRLFNLRSEEEDIQQRERDIQKEIEAKRNVGDIFSLAKLMNEDSIMKQEIAILQREEKDIGNPSKFKEDVQELIELENIESRLQFSTEENKELDKLQTLVNKVSLK